MTLKEFENLSGYKEISRDIVGYDGRWDQTMEAIVQNEESGKYYQCTWYEPKTESGWYDENQELELVEVVPKEKTIVVTYWETVENNAS